MAGMIVIADRDVSYAKALALRIQQHCPDSIISSVSDEQSLSGQLQSAKGPVTLIVTESHFATDNLPGSVTQAIMLHDRRRLAESDQTDAPVRMGSVLPILKRLDLARCRNASHIDAIEGSADLIHHARNCSSQSIASSPQSITDSGVSKPGQSSEDSPRIICCMTQTTTGRSLHYVDQRCRVLSEAGVRIYYLPLIPNYYCLQWSASESGYGLSDLILRIGSGGLSKQELGTFSSIDRLGRIHFRPADRADDLLQCRPQDLYQLCAMLRERIQDESGSVLLIEAAGIAFHQIRLILPLCDQIEAIIPDGSDYAANALLREHTDVLSDLPSVIKVIRVPERPDAGQRGSALIRNGSAQINGGASYVKA